MSASVQLENAKHDRAHMARKAPLHCAEAFDPQRSTVLPSGFLGSDRLGEAPTGGGVPQQGYIAQSYPFLIAGMSQ